MKASRTVQAAPIPSLRDAVGYFARLFTLIRPYWGSMARGLALSVIASALALVTPYFSKLYFDNVYPARDVSLMHVLVIGVSVFGLASALMGALRGYYTQVIGAKLANAASLMYFNHLQHLPIRFFDNHRVGEIMSRTGDLRNALGTASRLIQTVIVNGSYLVIVPPLLLALQWKLALLSLITTPVTATVSTAMSRVTRRFLKRSAEASADLNATQVETLTQIRTMKAMALEPHVFRDVATQTENALHLQMKTAGIGTLVGIANTVVRTVGTAAYTWYAWTLILRGDLSLGSFVAFSAYLGYLTGPVGQVTGLFADFQQSAVTLGRAFEYLDLSPEQDPELAYATPGPIGAPIRGTIRLNAVSFSYSPEKPVLTDLSVTIEQGLVTAFVGPSGAGKSTILRLLCGMERLNSGSILIDESPIDHFALADLRRQMAVVWQEPALLRGTIWENLTIGLEGADRSAVDEAVRLCRLTELIRELPDGYDTMVAEWGASLSGGQRQRFALARAIVRDTPVLLLDETTSQVDVRTEEEILRELIPHLRGKTVVLVTHRMATASLADRICILERGSLSAVGNHEELMRDSQSYRQMVQAAAGDEQRRMRVLGVV